MEETNYSRKTISSDCVFEDISSEEGPQDSSQTVDTKDCNKSDAVSNFVDIEVGVVSPIYKTKTYWEKLKLLDVPRPLKSLKISFIRPFTMIRFPAVLWCGFFFGSNLVWFNVFNASCSLIFTEYYGLSPSMVGVTFVAPIIGSSTTILLTGYLGDLFKIYMSKRNGGISEPEHRLWITLPFMFIVPGAMILWGVGAEHGINVWGLIIASGLLGTSAVGNAIAINYFHECYREMSGPGMVPIVVIKDVMSFGIGYAVTPWVETGFKTCFISAAFMAMFCYGTFIFVVIWGKKWRNSTKHAYWKYVQEAIDNGMAH